MIKYRLIPCPDCEGKGHISVESESGSEIGTFKCPHCSQSPKPGFVLEKIIEKKQKHHLTNRQSWRK